MVIVMVSFAEGHQRHELRVAGTAPARIALFAGVMAERVNAEGAVLDGNHTGHAGDEDAPSAAVQPPHA